MAVISAASEAITNLLARKLVRFAPTRDLVTANFLCMGIILLPAAPFFWQFHLSWPAIGFFALAASVDAAANIFYFRSFEVLPAVTASAILALSPLFSLLLYPFLSGGKPLTVVSVLGIMIVVAGLILLTRGTTNGTLLSWKQAREMGFPLLAAILFGVNIYPMRIILDAGWMNPYTYFLLRAFFIALVTFFVLRPKWNWVTGKRLAGLSGRVLFGITQWLLLLGALEIGNPAVVKTLADMSPLFVMALSWLILREPVGGWQAFGAVLTLSGMVLAVR